jgi:hypothetical protein
LLHNLDKPFSKIFIGESLTQPVELLDSTVPRHGVIQPSLVAVLLLHKDTLVFGAEPDRWVQISLPMLMGMDLGSESSRARSHRNNYRIRSHSRDSTASLECYLPHASIRAAADLTGCGDGIEDRRSARVEMEARRLEQLSHPGGLQFRPGQVWRTEITCLEEACGFAFACHGLAENWRETTAYAGDEDFVFASDRLKGKRPRVPNMLVEDHLRPAAKQVIEIPPGHRFGFHNLRHALTSFLVEIGTDSKTIQDMLRWADPSILLKVYAHSRMDKRMEAQAKMIEAMGLNEKTAQQLIQ